jgi:phosphoglycolate phosphatase-like HAD superfamily hydrolase
VTTVVERLAKPRRALGLVTGNIEEGARIKLLPTGLWPHFRVGAYGSDHMDRRRLPSVATRRAHSLVGYPFAPPEVVVIGDTPHDIDCARAFGAVAIAVTTGPYSRADLVADRPDFLFDDLGDVERVLAAVLGG